jgi:hypothetical protein
MDCADSMLSDRDRIQQLLLGEPSKTLNKIGLHECNEQISTSEQDGPDLQEVGEKRPERRIIGLQNEKRCHCTAPVHAEGDESSSKQNRQFSNTE